MVSRRLKDATDVSVWVTQGHTAEFTTSRLTRRTRGSLRVSNTSSGDLLCVVIPDEKYNAKDKVMGGGR